MKVGVVGGTFDPLHLGHLAMAEAAQRCACLDRVLLVPAADPPHRGDAVAPARDRLEMAQLAARARPWLEVSDIELRRGGPSYTVDTLRQLAGELPGASLYLVLGWDAAKDLPAWRQPDEVLRLARLIIVPRPGYPDPAPEDLRRLGIDPGRTTLCWARTPNAEATRIRKLAAEGASLAGLVDPEVEAYLRDHRLYASMGA